LKIFLKKYRERENGITLVEIVVVLFIVTLFSLIVINDFPKIQRQFALSRTSYKLAQDLRKTQDLGLSGVRINDVLGDPIAVKGYGIFIDLGQSATQYIIYADVNGNQKYEGVNNYCSQEVDGAADCIVEMIDISKENPNVYIKTLDNISGSTTSINFSPPNPIISIDNFIPDSESKVGIVFGLSTDSSATRTIWVNTSGLISVQ
jgi:Tfp pilus assembly protein FimT